VEMDLSSVLYNNTTFASSYKIHLSPFLYTCLTVHRVVPYSIGVIIKDWGEWGEDVRC